MCLASIGGKKSTNLKKWEKYDNAGITDTLAWIIIVCCGFLSNPLIFSLINFSTAFLSLKVTDS